jgi:DNA-binding HxlR family transcriptional regulator
LTKFPGQRVLAPATPDDQNFHRIDISAGDFLAASCERQAADHLRPGRFTIRSFMAKSRPTYNVLKPGCPSRLALERIADKWTALIIQTLARGTLRYSALQREIGDISQKVLTQTLRGLERDGLVRRKVYDNATPKVEYMLTSLGRTLIGPLQGLCLWSEKYLPQLEAHRRSSSDKITPGNGQ